MSGQSGTRGYLLQTLITLLDTLSEDPSWSSVTLEPNNAADSVDVLWRWPYSRTKVVQVKSSQNQITVPAVKKWAVKLQASSSATEYQLSLVGPVSKGVAGLKRHKKVAISEPRNLDGLLEQAAHKLALYASTRGGKTVLHPSAAHMAASAVATQMLSGATRGTELTRAAFEALLDKYISHVSGSPIDARQKTHAPVVSVVVNDAAVSIRQLLQLLSAEQPRDASSCQHLYKTYLAIGEVITSSETFLQALADSNLASDRKEALRCLESLKLNVEELGYSIQSFGQLFELYASDLSGHLRELIGAKMARVKYWTKLLTLEEECIDSKGALLSVPAAEPRHWGIRRELEFSNDSSSPRSASLAEALENGHTNVRRLVDTRAELAAFMKVNCRFSDFYASIPLRR